MAPDTYEAALATTHAAVHLAALTGKASRTEHFRINEQGTAMFVDACQNAGVGRLLFVSSIATKFPDHSDYHYAQAKARAEAVVRASRLKYTIVRPTMIFGKGSPVLNGLDKLAGLPLIPVFGDGRTQVQPIYVDDLASFIVEILEQDRFGNETLDLGGPSSLSIENLLQEIRTLRKGSPGRALHIPLSLFLPFLRTAEKLGFGHFLPVSAGQLSSFRFDGTIENNPLFEDRKRTLQDVQSMLSHSYS